VRPEARPAGAVQETGGKGGEGPVDEVWFDAMLDATGGEAATGPLNRKG